MTIAELQIRNFRNLESVTIQTSPHFNLFYGHNGSGKTSLLEAIHYLGLGKSFRASQADHIIQHHAPSLSIFAHLSINDRMIPAGIERHADGAKKMKLDGAAINRLSIMAQQIPLQLISTESHRFFYDGPKVRRQFLDWGVFHVEHNFFPQWQQVQQIIKQRNASIKSRQPHREVVIWNQDLVPLAEEISNIRRNYIAKLEPVLNQLLGQLLHNKNLALRYFCGWDENKGLSAVLMQDLSRDFHLGYTQSGPQRADVQLYFGEIPAQDYLSQGQLKLASYALHLAQGLLMSQEAKKSPIYLIDDLPSELDNEKRDCIIDVLTSLSAQVFVTGIDKADMKGFFAQKNTEMFHVEHGVISRESGG